MAFLENLAYILGGFVVLVVIFLIVLSVIEKKLSKRVMSGGFRKNQKYMEKLSGVNFKKPEESLRTVDKLARNFFQEAFKIKGSPDYSELEDLFTKKHNKKAKEFSSKMTTYMYSGAKINEEELQKMIVTLAEIIGSNKIITGEEKKVLDRKAMENQKTKKSFLKKFVGKFRKKK